MNLQNTLLTFFEIALVAFAVWAVFHEDIEFEQRLVSRFRRRRLKVIRGGSQVCKTYRPEKHRA